ncbi:hypothetical protein QJS10_CPB21g00320 [Acorus calamus]|uniref:C2H2-type domain-containing protein n=1 Tax=Acorus calamus TaxID=4465 RepID=A0AAV9C5I0_ACOCL|nr:hypothetical protein QJS10_CPB21g00320 [Acorus calamus]
MVYDALNEAKEGTSKPLPVDEDLPGMGQFYCLHCDRYFANVLVRDDHFRTKLHKKRAKQMNKVFEADDAQIPRIKRRREEQPPHTQLDADLAAGMGMPDNGPKLGFT